MDKKEIIKRMVWVPWWVLSLLAAFISAIVSGILVNYVDETVNYIIWSSLQVIFSFLICLLHPGKTWYVPLVCNVLVVLPAAFDNTFWNTSFGLIIGAGLVFSFLMGHLGGLIGRGRNRNLYD